MDEDELEEALLNGETLCLLDDLVLDIGEYARYHPGGRFLIAQNVGRDASKFFYGGYTMANNDTTHGYAHSNYARKVANSLAVATFNRVTKTMKSKLDSS
jgi:cytochrome b involved in lipid metabolism